MAWRARRRRSSARKSVIAIPDARGLTPQQLADRLAQLRQQESALVATIERGAAISKSEPAAIKHLRNALSAVQAAKPARIRDIFFGARMTDEERSLGRRIQEAECAWRRSVDSAEAAAIKARTELPSVRAMIKGVGVAIDRAKKEAAQAAKSAPTIAPPNDAAGWLYALLNPMYGPDVLKIGLSTRTPEERAIEISSPTGVALPYSVAHKVFVTNCRKAERLIHSRLDRCRLTSTREFFRLSLTEYVRAVDLMLREVPGLVPPSAKSGTQLEEGAVFGRVQFKGTPTWTTIETKKPPEQRQPPGRPWVPPWVKQ